MQYYVTEGLATIPTQLIRSGPEPGFIIRCSDYGFLEQHIAGGWIRGTKTQ